jgi:hypothetical protein
MLLQASKMAFFNQIADDHGTDNVLPIHYSYRNPALTIPVGLMDDLRMQRVKFLLAEACRARPNL